MADSVEVSQEEKHMFTVYKADAGGARFKVKSMGSRAVLTLNDVERPHNILYEIQIGDISSITIHYPKIERIESETSIDLSDYVDMVLTWHEGVVILRKATSQKPVVKTKDLEGIQILRIKFVGYIRFYATDSRNSDKAQWIYEASPIDIPKTISPKKIDTGELRWVQFTGSLPKDAVIGGYENSEIVYVARSLHNRSLCPGKYVPSMKIAFVAWGRREHTKHRFEVLCGFDAQWVAMCSNGVLPINAFVAGYSEDNGEQLYVIRAVPEVAAPRSPYRCERPLVPGKFHTRYNCGYIPYKGREVEVGTACELLVVPRQSRAGDFVQHKHLLEGGFETRRVLAIH